MRCASGKRQFATYAAALAALEDLRARGLLRDPIGAVYECARCDGWHVSSRKYALSKKRGRGKTRRKILERIA